MTPPIRSARPIAARAPATSVPRPAMSGQRLAASKPAASASARSSAAGLPPIQALPILTPRRRKRASMLEHAPFRRDRNVLQVLYLAHVLVGEPASTSPEHALTVV